MRSRILFFSIIFVLVAMAGAAFAAPIDLWDNFPDTQGQNHFFALALPWNNTGEYSYVWLDHLDSFKFGTLNETVANVPFIFKGSDPWIQMYPASNGGANGPGLELTNVLYSYKVPTDGAGFYDITGSFQKAGTGDTYVFVKQNQNFLWNHTFSLSDANGATASFNLPHEHFGVDDKIYFGVGCGANQSSIGDLTFLSGQINAVPEPVSCVLFLIGGAMVGARLRRKKS